jgi:ubiquinone/menaquinone biosynthesis C-methylase UbiE
MDIHLMRYNGVTLPFADRTFDKVVSSLVVHHLSAGERPGIFKELHRVLKNGGELHILDFGIQRTRYARSVTAVLKYLEPIGENLHGMIPEYLRLAEFKDIEEVHYENTLFGSVSLYRSKKMEQCGVLNPDQFFIKLISPCNPSCSGRQHS